jgi:hypothetical protein
LVDESGKQLLPASTFLMADSNLQTRSILDEEEIIRMERGQNEDEQTGRKLEKEKETTEVVADEVEPVIVTKTIISHLHEVRKYWLQHANSDMAKLADIMLSEAEHVKLVSLLQPPLTFHVSKK